MRENDNVEESNTSSKNFPQSLSRINTNKSEVYIEMQDKNPISPNRNRISSTSSQRNSQTSFDRALLYKIRKEEEEENLRKIQKEREKLLGQVNSLLRKDYIVFFFLLFSSAFNFNYLFLPTVGIAIIYFPALEKLSRGYMKLKYFLEIFSLGYTSYLFIFKVVTYSLIKNKNNSIIENKNVYIDYGVSALKNLDSNYYFIFNFLPELVLMAVCGYGVLTSFRCRLLKENDKIPKVITGEKLTKYIFIIYLFFATLTNYNLSYLSLFYMLSIQFLMLLNSLKFHERIIKNIMKIILHILCFVMLIQIILINYFNVPSIQQSSEDYYNELVLENDNKKYFSWKQIGIFTNSSDNYFNYPNNTYYYKPDDSNKSAEPINEIIFLKFQIYFFSILTLIIVKNTINKLNMERKYAPQNSNIDNTNNRNRNPNQNKTMAKINGFITKVITNIILFLSHPTFNFEASRILSITWTYFYRNIYSLGILIFISLSFFSVHKKKNKYLVLYLLTPMLILSLCAFHISNIDGLYEELRIDETKKNSTIPEEAEEYNEELINKLGYMRNGILKFDYPKIEYLIGHIYFIIVMFCINSIYTAELRPKPPVVEEKKDELKKEKTKKIEEKEEEKEEGKEEKEEVKEEEKNEEKKDTDKKAIGEIDTKNSINDSVDNNSYLLENLKDEEEEKKKKEEENKKKEAERRKSSLIDKNKINSANKNIKFKQETITFFSLITKGIFTHIDKITLIIMYLVAVYTVNLIHVILVLILIFQIIAPGKLNGCYKMIVLIFQLLYLIEFIIDLLKIKYNETFNEYKTLLQFFFVYSGDIEKNDVEIFIYGVILCFYFQFRTSNIHSIKNILNNRKIVVGEFIQLKLRKYPIIQKYIFILGNTGLHFYLWSLIFLFIFFNSYFEINFIFGIKLIIFLICCYQFIYLVQTMSRYKSLDCVQLLNRILLFLCCINTLLVYLYQFLCKDFLNLKKMIEKNNSFFVKNLPNFGFTIYKEENYYYNFLPHFMTTFIAVLYIWQSEETLDLMLKANLKRKNTNSLHEKEKMKKKALEKRRMFEIKQEKNEFIQDKLYADKYDENSVDLDSKSRDLIKARIFLFFTDCYWISLFFIVGIIFISYDLSFSIVIYVLIFGILSIVMFFKIIIKLKNYIKNKSYFISKVIRYSIVERPRNIEINKKFRVLTFQSLLFYSFIYFAFLYFYGIFDLYQNGCSEDLFLGCVPSSNYPIFGEDIEDIIKSYSFLFGIYVNVREENILKVSMAHLILTLLIILDLYNQKLADYYSNISETLISEIQKLVNENNVLQKYADVADLNILIKIGLSIAGIDLTAKKKGKRDSRISLADRFYVPPPPKIDSIINFDPTKINYNLNKINENPNENGEDGDEPAKVDEPKSNIMENYDLNEKDPSNKFLENKKIKRFINIIKNSNENEQQLSLSNSKDRIVRFVKKLIEELIIFISLCLALSKLNIYTFVYIFVTIILISTKKTMFKYYLLYIFIYLAIVVQSIFYILNITTETSPREKEKDLFYALNQTMSIPLYKEQYNLTAADAFFYGLGVNKSQVNLIWLEFMQIIVIYFYLNYFSYSIYQDIINLGSSSLSDQRFDFETLNMEQGSLEQIKTMTEFEFYQFRECLSCFNFNIGNTLDEFFKLLKINKDIHINIFDANAKNKLNLNLTSIKNPVLKELIEYRMYEKEYLNNIEIREKGKYKPLPSYLLILQKILYLYFHCFLLILIIMISIMTAGPISCIYFGAGFYYLIKSDCIFLGQEYSYPKAIKRSLRIIVLIDIILQGIYQLPIFYDGTEITYKIFSSLGFVKIIKVDDNEIQSDLQLEIFGKALIYFFMSLQNLIYNSKTFKLYYLVYLLENKFQTNKTSLVNAFTFNNDRVKVYQKSLAIRQKTVESMNNLNDLINELNSKLNKVGDKIFSKNKFEVREKPLDFLKYNQLKEEEENKSNNNDNPDKSKIFLEEDDIKEKIRSMLYDRFITKLYLWLHKHSANYKNVDKNAKNDFYIETIKGETTIKSIIESDINTALSILDLTGFEKNDMKDIELLIESQFDKKKKQFLEEKRLKETKSKKNINKFKKFGNNLLRLNRFAKMIYGGQYKIGDILGNNIKNREGIDIVELFRIQTEKERAEKEKKEREIQIKKQKLGYIEDLFGTKLFKKYLKTPYQIRHIILYLQSFFMNNFTWICYFFMILDHMVSASIISIIYPLSIFCYALLEYPRPKKYYWMACLIYTMIIMFIKFIIQLKVVLVFITEDTYEDLILNLYNYRIGFRYFKKTFSRGFIKYICFDALIIFSILINRNLLITEGLWFQREEEIENIYEASERISIYKTKKYNNKFEAMQDLLLKYIYTPREAINIKKILDQDKENTKNIIQDKRNTRLVKHKFPFFGKRNRAPEYNEAKKSYYNKMFTKTRNEKPGNDYYASYTLVMFLICMYILLFFTKMDQDKTYGPVNLDTTQFSGNMVIYLIFHILILVVDRIIFVVQNRENIEYEYYFYKRNPNNNQGELISERELNDLRSEITKYDENSKYNNISPKEIERLKERFNILFIQKEQFNKPLLNKYILHIFTTIFSHAMIFFYFPIKGNINLGNGIICTDKVSSCNNFTSNKYIIIFYIFYLIYLVLSSLQIRFGFFDIRRKSLFKKKDDELFSNMCSLFQAIPFLNEIKNALDWTFTSTCFNLIQWNKYEAIYDAIFDTYCEKSDWDERPVGKRISRKEKLTIGASLATVLILILVVPLILFSSLNPTNILNNLTSAKIKVDLSFTYENGAKKKYNIFENTRADSILEIDSEEDSEDDLIWETCGYSKSAQTKNFNKKQVQRVIFSEASDRNWDLAIPHINNLISLLDLSEGEEDISSIDINIGYELTRPLPAEAQTCSDSFEINIYNKGDLNNPYGVNFIKNISDAMKNCYDTNVFIEDAYSPPLRLTSGSEVTEIEDDNFEKRGLEIGFEGCTKDSNNNINYFNSFFTIKSVYKDKAQPLELHVFSDQISETTFGYSVLTFYITFVLLAGDYVREFLQNEPEKIMIEELPHAKKIVDLCEGIRTARYCYDFKNEEYLYTLLIELMRSPDYLKIITDSSLDHFKQREEIDEEED